MGLPKRWSSSRWHFSRRSARSWWNPRHLLVRRWDHRIITPTWQLQGLRRLAWYVQNASCQRCDNPSFSASAKAWQHNTGALSLQRNTWAFHLCLRTSTPRPTFLREQALLNLERLSFIMPCPARSGLVSSEGVPLVWKSSTVMEAAFSCSPNHACDCKPRCLSVCKKCVLPKNRNQPWNIVQGTDLTEQLAAFTDFLEHHKEAKVGSSDTARTPELRQRACSLHATVLSDMSLVEARVNMVATCHNTPTCCRIKPLCHAQSANGAFRLILL